MHDETCSYRSELQRSPRPLPVAAASSTACSAIMHSTMPAEKAGVAQARAYGFGAHLQAVREGGKRVNFVLALR